MNDKENAAIGANSNFGLSNSMMSSGAPSTGTSGGSSFGNAKYDSLYKKKERACSIELERENRIDKLDTINI